jgi:hypothetical protein
MHCQLNIGFRLHGCESKMTSGLGVYLEQMGNYVVLEIRRISGRDGVEDRSYLQIKG